MYFAFLVIKTSGILFFGPKKIGSGPKNKIPEFFITKKAKKRCNYIQPFCHLSENNNSKTINESTPCLQLYTAIVLATTKKKSEQMIEFKTKKFKNVGTLKCCFLSPMEPAFVFTFFTSVLNTNLLLRPAKTIH